MKKNIWKRLLSLAMALALTVGLLPGLVLEAEAAKSYTDDGFTVTICNVRRSDKNGEYQTTNENPYWTVNGCYITHQGNGVYTYKLAVVIPGGSYTESNGEVKNFGDIVYSGSNGGFMEGTFTVTDCTKTFSVTKEHTRQTADNFTPGTWKWDVIFTRNDTQTEHIWENKITEQPNCTDYGTRKDICVNCAYSKNIEAIDPEPDAHSYEWISSNGTHKQVCKHNSAHVGQTGACSGVKCGETGNCTVCGASYAVTHNIQWTKSIYVDVHWRGCTNEGCYYTEAGTEGYCSGGTATCGQQAVCDICGKEYGTLYTHELGYTQTNEHTLVETCLNNCGHRAEATLAPTQSEYTFNPNSVNGTGKATVTFSGNWMGSKEYDCFYEGNFSVGTATARAKIHLEGGTSRELTCSFKINPADISNSFVQAYPDVYNGMTLQPAVFYRENKDDNIFSSPKLEEGTDYTIAWNTDEQVGAGSYVITVTGKGNFTGSFTQTITIDAADLSGVTVKQAGTLTYDGGNALTPEVSASAVAVNGQPITFVYSTLEDGTYGSLPSFTEAGEYTVYYKASAPNHKDATGSFTVEIENANPVVTAPTANDLIYDGTSQELLVPGTAIGGKVLYSRTIDGPFAEAIPEAINAGTYTVWYIVLGEKNYNSDWIPKSVSVSITKADQEVPVVGKTDETISEKNDGIITGVDPAMEYRKDSESAYTAITGTEVTGLADGTYFVRYKETGNFNASSETEVTIAAGRKLTVTVPDDQVGYTFTSSVDEFDWMGDFSVTLEIHEGYSKTENFKYMIDGQEFNDRIEDGTDEFAGACADFVFGIEGIADITPPVAEIQLKDNRWNQFWNGITFGLFFKETQDVTIAADDKGSGVDAIYYYLSDRELELDEVKAITGWQEYNGTFRIDPENKYVIYAKAVDKDGNSTYINSDGVILDSIVPVISGVADGETCYTTQKVSVTDDNLNNVTVNGNEVTGEIILEGNADSTYTIVATDKAGNSTTVTVTMKPIRELAKATENLGSDNVTSADAPALEELVKKLDELIADPDTSDDGERETLEQHKVIAENLLQTVSEAAEAANTENTEKVKDVTAKNVTSADKADLEEAKADLEQALETHGSNYTAEEKKAIEEELERIDGALAALNRGSGSAAPQTGDSHRLLLWIALLLISGAAACGIAFDTRKRRADARR